MITRSTHGKTLASNQEWRAWGDVDPFYGVATKPGRAKGSTTPWAEGEFARLGATDWAFFRPKWEQYGVSRGSCLEIGCGAGRMTVQLAAFFETVYGLDVSPGMLNAARRIVPSNVNLQVSDGVHFPVEDASVSAIFSTHVLQHFSSTHAGAACFGEMYRVLEPGGTIMVHLPVISWPGGSLRRVHYFVHKIKTFMDSRAAGFRRWTLKIGLSRTPPMQVISYEINWLHRTLRHAGFVDIEIRTLLGGSEMAVQHPFVFARKKQAA